MSAQSTGGLFDAPPKTTFFMGLFLGIAATAVLALLFGLGSGSSSRSAESGGTNSAAVAGSGDTVPSPSPTPTAKTAGAITEPSSETDHYRGVKPEDAAVVLVEYSDYECPFCKRHHPTMKQVLEEYDGKVSWVYRHFPLDSLHSQATPAALAAECISALGGNDAFWEFTDAMFENQSSLGDALYLAQAKAAGVSESAFTDCYENKEYQSALSADVADGTSGGVTGTPGTIVMQGTDTASAQLISGALPYASIAQVIDGML